MSFIGFSQRAEALPSFARQTGQPCGTCHTDFPGLTPFGRLFKLNGYTTGGGKYRTTLFPFHDGAKKALADYAKKAKAEDSGDSAKKSPSDTSDTWVPPISMMTIFGFTHRDMSLDPDAASPFNPNDNVRVEQFSLFWGGAITEHIGVFSQFTYGGPPVGGPDPADPYSSMQWGWDNTDIRYANTGRLDKFDVIYGITANNNPTVGDPWNTTPAWGFPYAAAGDLAPGPGAATLIDGALGVRSQASAVTPGSTTSSTSNCPATARSASTRWPRSDSIRSARP